MFWPLPDVVYVSCNNLLWWCRGQFDFLTNDVSGWILNTQLSVICWALFQVGQHRFPFLLSFFLSFFFSSQSFLLASAKPGAWEYSVTEYTDQPALVLVEDIVREKLLVHLDKEIPYSVTQVREMVFLAFGRKCLPANTISLCGRGSHGYKFDTHMICIPWNRLVIELVIEHWAHSMRTIAQELYTKPQPANKQRYVSCY